MLQGANRPDAITRAIQGNVGGMGALNGRLTATDIADIAAYLASPGI